MKVFEEILKLTVGERVQAFIFIFSFIFMIFSCLGWVLEVFFRRFFSAKKWVNPGFLKGPYLPIYGIGIVTLSVYVLCLLPFIDKFPNQFLFDLTVIIGIGILMTLIELIGGLIFIKGMHIRLWDYSKQWGNYKGIICPLFSLIWTVAGALFYYFVFDKIIILVTKFVSLDWFVLAVFLIGIFFGIFILDFITSLQIGQKIKNFAKENRFVIAYEKFKEDIHDDIKARHEKTSFTSPFKTNGDLKEHLSNYFKKHIKKEDKDDKDNDDIKNEETKEINDDKDA